MMAQSMGPLCGSLLMYMEEDMAFWTLERMLCSGEQPPATSR
jgi:hypothetical protein